MADHHLANMLASGDVAQRLAELLGRIDARDDRHQRPGLEQRQQAGQRFSPIEAARAGLPADFAGIDVLVNNAGLALGTEPAQRASLDEWQTMIDTNCSGLVTVTHTLVPGMIARGRGHIFNLGSVAGTYPYAGGNVYGATKAFVRQFSLNLRTDLLGTPLRVTDIEPGLCGGTEFSNVRFRGDDEKAANVYANVEPLTAEDIADTIYWIATRPAHVNINTVEMMPVAQAPAGLAVHRG